MVIDPVLLRSMTARLRLMVALICLLVACSGCGIDRSNTTPAEDAPTAEEQTQSASPVSPSVSPISTHTPSDSEVSEDEDIIVELNDMVTALDSVKPGTPLDDLYPLMAMIANADVVGLGEATHGTSEFVTVRHRIVELLVEEMGFTHIALEAPWEGIEVANRYVQGEHEDASAAQDGLTYFMLQNREAWEMLEWLREYNLGMERTRRVQISGVDSQSRSSETSRIVLDFIKSVDPAAYQEFEDLYSDLDQSSLANQSADQTQKAFDMLEDRRDQYVEESSNDEYEHSLHAARVISQGQKLRTMEPSEGVRLRDQFMADNVDRVLELDGSDARVVFWAHNSHVSKGDIPTLEAVPSVGAHLNERHGEKYFAIGTDFAEGSFVAQASGENLSQSLTEFTVDSTPPHTFAHLFRELKPSEFILDLRRIDQTTPAGGWLSTRLAMRTVGCCRAPYSDSVVFVELTESFDALVFIEHTSSVELLENDVSP